MYEIIAEGKCTETIYELIKDKKYETVIEILEHERQVLYSIT